MNKIIKEIFDKKSWKLILELNIIIWVFTLMIWGLDATLNLRLERFAPTLRIAGDYVGYAVAILIFSYGMTLIAWKIYRYFKER